MKHKQPSKNVLEFINLLDNFTAEQNKKPFSEREIMPPITDAQLVVDCLCDVFLGEGWYVGLSMGQQQVNTVILDNILDKYYKPYRKYPKKDKSKSTAI